MAERSAKGTTTPVSIRESFFLLNKLREFKGGLALLTKTCLLCKSNIIKDFRRLLCQNGKRNQ